MSTQCERNPTSVAVDPTDRTLFELHEAMQDEEFAKEVRRYVMATLKP